MNIQEVMVFLKSKTKTNLDLKFANKNVILIECDLKKQYVRT